jgi:hypothetical protein
MLGKHTLFTCKNSHKANKKRITDLRKSLCAGGWQDKFPGSCEHARAVLIRALVTLEEARIRMSSEKNRVDTH